MRLILSTFVVSAVCGGCTHLEPISKSKLIAPVPSVKNGVVLDVVYARFPLGDSGINDEAFQEVDELQVPADRRRRLEANGLRVGVISGPLPLKLEELLKLSPTTPKDEGPQAIDVDRQPPVKQRQLHLRGGRRANLVVLGEKQRRDELTLLLRTDDERVQGRTYKQVLGLFAARAFPTGDGGVRLEMTPELEHGEPGKRFTPGEGTFKVEYGPPHEVLDQLRWTTDLAPGQMLIVTAIPARTGSLGYQLFTEHDGDSTLQKLLLVRLARCEFDDRFSDAPPNGPAEDR